LFLKSAAKLHLAHPLAANIFLFGVTVRDHK
jgi:hypothetical protein